MKLKFFENIYYWLWKCVPKFKGAHTPPNRACLILSILKAFNMIFLIAILSAFLKQNMFSSIWGESKNAIILGAVISTLIITWNDEKRYAEKHEEILAKINNLTLESRKKRLLIFIVYIIISVVVFWGLFPFLTKFYF